MQCDRCKFKKEKGCLATKSRIKKKENRELAQLDKCKSYEPDFFEAWDKIIKNLDLS